MMTVGQMRFRISLTALVALILTVLPLPTWLDVLRPAFLVLTVLYWSINTPRAAGIGLGFLCGLLLDVFQGPVLGEHALALSIVAYVAKTSPRMVAAQLFALDGALPVEGFAIGEIEGGAAVECPDESLLPVGPVDVAGALAVGEREEHEGVEVGLVFDETGKLCRIIHVHPIEVPFNAYRLTFDDGATQDCSGAQPSRRGEWRSPSL